ncbi:glycosyl transferase, family 9 [Lebetimonas natsushimae]|uniref:Glycosyl transferase, family 9 n=1 Tax=Lebetimonas natsushimae TaxID=1936991 RepID=A0A292Y9U7_9BACT|nr:glycosyltransferase family 9 protein [Lebetimonas natsushimae]GAX86807.1 glycosyl transferase, family 9 [Lebetimonas natsushimae]
MKFLEKFLNLFLGPAKPIDSLKINENHTFIVISNTGLGDTILSTPAIKSLKKSFPQNKIIAVLKKSHSPLFKNFKYIDKIIEYDGKYKGFFKTLFKLKKYKNKITLIFHSNGPQDIQLAILSGSEYILKHPTNSYLKKYLSYDFTKKTQHNIEDKLDLVRKIGGKNIDKTMEIGDVIDSDFKEFKNYIGFQVGSVDFCRMWPIERFSKLAEILIKNNEKIVILGAENEKYLGDKIIKTINNKNIINMCGKTDLVTLANIVNNLKMLITNDTGTMHLAIALKIPTISLFSASDSNAMGPYQNLEIHRVIQKDGSFIQKLPKKKRDDSAMKLIEVDEVYEKYKELNEYLKGKN